MKTVLVTGGAGFIGSNYVRHLFDNYPDYKIIVVDALTYAGNIESLPVDITKDSNERFEFWYGNIKNADLIDTLVSQSDIVIHFAAETHVTRSIYDNFLFFETDVLGTQVIANAVLKYKDRIDRMIHISTSEVYGTALAKKMDEEHPLKPKSPYASAKAGADRLIYSYWATYELPVTILRPFNNYGPSQHLEKAVPRFITSCMLGEAIHVHGDGSAARDYIHSSDTCSAIESVMNAPLEKVAGEVFNISTDEHRSIISIAEDVTRMTGTDPSCINFVGERPGQVFRHTGDSTKIRKNLGWQPRLTWEEGLQQAIKWYSENRPFWEKQLWMKSVPIVTRSGKREFH